MHSSPPRARLDSWKEIAAYLGRDVRTAMRWAKAQGLPVRRVAGGRGHSVFAFTGEIDAWLASQTATPAPAPSPGVLPTSRPWAVGRWMIGVLVLVGAAALVSSGLGWAPSDPSDVTVTVEGNAVAIRTSHGGTRVIHPFDSSTVVVPIGRTGGSHVVADLDDDRVPEILVGVSYRQLAPDQGGLRSGEILSLSTAGHLHWRYEPTVTLRFPRQSFSSPWSIVDWQVSPGPGRRRVAVVSHHYIWWPALVTVLDDGGHEVGSFVNSGWIEHVQWLDNGRLLISGFDNARNGGMMAVVDARHPTGHAPNAGASDEYVCQSCPEGNPLVYIVFPRSEVNLAASARFNRAQTQILSDRIVATTTEGGGDNTEIASALYEFGPDLTYEHATYGDRYWDEHHRLEVAGLIQHPREKCPQKNGPDHIDVWTRDQGWRRIQPSQPLIR
jgi:hypothetical protein